MNRPGGKQQDEFRTAVTTTVVWVAGLTLGIIFLALFAGILLDRFLHTKPIFTILLMVTSIPVTIYLTFRVVKSATGRLQPPAKTGTSEEELKSGEND
ncbi:MAG TPA: AtpZ/AtpI family protein [Anaerolineales bacterium]|nr:AtpZ/AtpI family protein [Anaerolineales bacterium]